jgi:tetratricopeptide (TPR) repeat protein
MSSVYSHGEASKDAPLYTPNRSKSFRKILSSKLPGFAHADRTDAATPRGGGRSDRRDPPAGITADESEISQFNEKGNEFFDLCEYDAALRMYSEALKLLKQPTIIMDLDGDGDECMSEAVKRFRTARCLVNIGAVHIRRNDFDDAISVLELSLRQSKLIKPNSSLYIRACEVKADASENIGLILFKRKEYERCLVMYTDALEARRKCLDLMEAKHKKWGRKSKDVARQYNDERNAILLELSMSLFYMTLLREKLGDVKGAVEGCEEVIKLRRVVIPDSKKDPNSLNLFSTIGRLYCHENVKRHGDALGYFHEVHRMKSDISGRDHLDVVPSLNFLALIYIEIGDYKRSAAISDQAIEIATKGRGLNKETCIAYVNKGDAHKHLKDYEKAIDCYEAALKTQSKLLDSYDLMNAEVLEKLADAYLLSKEYYMAISSMEKAFYVKMKDLGPDSQVLARSHSKLGDIYEACGQHSNGIKCHTRALRIFKHHDNKEMAATEHNKIATILKTSGEKTKAMEHYMAALWHSREARLPSTDPIVADTIKNVAAFQQV